MKGGNKGVARIWTEIIRIRKELTGDNKGVERRCEELKWVEKI